MGVLATVPEQKTQAEIVLNREWPKIVRMLPRHITPERQLAVFRKAMENPKLKGCDMVSVLDCIVGASCLGFDVAGPMAYAHLVPFNHKTLGPRASLIIDYKGYVQLIYNSGKADRVFAEIRYEKDHWKEIKGTNPSIEHVPVEGDRGEPIGAYAVVDIKGGKPVSLYLTKEQILRYKEMSKAKDSYDSPWNSPNIDVQLDMWKKTALRRLQKYIPKSAEMLRAEEFDTKADLGESLLIDVETVEAKNAASDLSERVERARSRQKATPPKPEPAKPDEPAPPPQGLDDEPVPFDSEAPEPSADIPFIPFDCVSGLSVGTVFCTQAQIETVYPKRGPKSPAGYMLTDGSTKIGFKCWDSVPEWAVRDVRVAISKAEVAEPYNGKDQFVIREWCQL